MPASDLDVLRTAAWWDDPDVAVLASGARHPRGCGGTHSRLPDGRMLCWRPEVRGAWRVALDAEPGDAPVPPALAARMTDQPDAWGAWTRAEVCAKLLDVPVVRWAASGIWPPEGVQRRRGAWLTLRTERRGGLVVSFGALRVEE